MPRTTATEPLEGEYIPSARSNPSKKTTAHPKTPTAKTKATLTDTLIRQAKPATTPFKLSDEKGMFLLINPNGSKYWRLKYRIGGREKLLALGVYPQVSLKEARDYRDDARKLIANGVDPSELRKAEKITLTEAKQAQIQAAEVERLVQAGEALPGSFREVGDEWAAKYLADKSPKYRQKVINRLSAEVYPYLGNLPVNAITAPLILEVLRRIEARGIIESAYRVKQNIGQILRYAIATSRAENDPTPALGGALTPMPKDRHHAAPTEPKTISPLLRIMAGYKGAPLTKCALTLAPLLFVRPGELRHMEWAHVDLDAAEWRYTATKTGQEHLVPLARQAIAALREIQPLTGGGRYVFPGARSDSCKTACKTDQESGGNSVQI